MNGQARRTDGRSVQYVTVGKAAGMLGVPPSVIHRAVRLGLVRASSRHGLVVVRESDVVRHLCGAR